MALLGLALIGSRARDDAADTADVDLFAVTSDPAATTRVFGCCTLSSHPYGTVLRRARTGDLFVLHVVAEARVLFETWPVFDSIRDAFTWRPSYAREIRLASDVGWFLVRHWRGFAAPQLVARRVAWCTRTILIARAAEQRQPVFGARQLAARAANGDVLDLLAAKHRDAVTRDVMRRFAGLLLRSGAAPPPALGSLRDERRRFDADRNVVGSALVRTASGHLPSTASHRSPCFGRQSGEPTVPNRLHVAR